MSRPLLCSRAIPLRLICITSHVWLFYGAEGGPWLEKLQDEQAQQALTENANSGLKEIITDNIHDPALREAKKQKFR